MKTAILMIAGALLMNQGAHAGSAQMELSCETSRYLLSGYVPGDSRGFELHYTEKESSAHPFAISVSNELEEWATMSDFYPVLPVTSALPGSIIVLQDFSEKVFTMTGIINDPSGAKSGSFSFYALPNTIDLNPEFHNDDGYSYKFKAKFELSFDKFDVYERSDDQIELRCSATYEI